VLEVDRNVELNMLIEAFTMHEYFEVDHIRLEKAEQRLHHDLNTLERTKTNIEILQDKMKATSQSYKENRLIKLEKATAEYIARLFPEDNYILRFRTAVYRGNEFVDLYSGRNERSLAPMQMQHGRLFRQFAGFTITMVIQEIEGCKLSIMDESLNSGDTEILKNISKIIKERLDSGVQIIMIEHKHEIYTDLPRLQHTLERDTTKNSVVVLSSEERY